MSKKNYAIVGVAGYVAPKHMKAIKDVGGNLVAALDPHDSVGVLDSHFPDCQYFSEFERFDRFCSKTDIDYVAVCSPNYLHDAHCRFSLRIGASPICEKPLVLNERNLDGLQEMEEQYGKKINTILQLRLNTDLIALREKIQSGVIIDNDPSLTYYTPRGDWYKYSWKSNKEKSGSIVFNIGIHLFDMLQWIYGEPISYEITNIIQNETIQGKLYCDSANVNFELSINKHNEPIRTLTLDGYSYSFTKGFTNLHTKSYQEILEGNGFGIEDVRTSIRICEKLREYY
jgi:UDP-N-acetyl-2-amino-2-deoxyglucuronate dehydrogenase